MKPDDIEKFNKEKYERDYSPAQLSINKTIDERDYFQKLVRVKLDLVKKYGAGKCVLDVGCGSGDYLFEVKDVVSSGIGVDYTQTAIDQAIDKKKQWQAANLEFSKENARSLPYRDGTFDLVFSFSALAYIPQLGDVIKEFARVLKKGGVAVLDLGNARSLNTVVCDAYPEWAKSCHVPISAMKEMIGGAHLEVLEWRSFQILPLWGNRPASLRFLLHPVWKRLLQKPLAGKMLDEWISNLPLVRGFAFRHIVVCRK